MIQWGGSQRNEALAGHLKTIPYSSRGPSAMLEWKAAAAKNSRNPMLEDEARLKNVRLPSSFASFVCAVVGAGPGYSPDTMSRVVTWSIIHKCDSKVDWLIAFAWYSFSDQSDADAAKKTYWKLWDKSKWKIYYILELQRSNLFFIWGPHNASVLGSLRSYSCF